MLLALVGGCMVGPDYKRPEAKVNETYAEGGDGKVNVEWWQTFNDPVLVDLIETCYRQNLTLRQAGVRVLQSMAARGIAVGDLFPQSQAIQGTVSRGVSQERYATNWGVGFDAAWEIDFWGKFRRAIEASDAELDGSLAQYDSVMVSLFGEVASTYVTIRTFDERLAIAHQNIAALQKSLDIVQEKLDAGATSEIDVAQAKSLLKSTQSLIPAFEAGRKQAIYALAALLGRPPDPLQDILGKPGTIPQANAEVAVGAPAELLRRLPSVRIAERGAAAASADIGVAKADLYPSFFLNGSIGLSSNKFSSLWNSSAWTGVIEPGFSWPIFNYGRIRNNVRVADANFQAAALNYQQTVLDAASDVESSLAAYVGSLDQTAFVHESLTLSQRAYDLSMIQYREGDTPYTRVIQTQESLLSVSDSYASLRGSIALNLVATYKALGGGWEIRKGVTELVPEETKKEMRERTNWGSYLDEDPVAAKTLIPRHDPDKIAREPVGDPK